MSREDTTYHIIAIEGPEGRTQQMGFASEILPGGLHWDLEEPIYVTRGMVGPPVGEIDTIIRVKNEIVARIVWKDRPFMDHLILSASCNDVLMDFSNQDLPKIVEARIRQVVVVVDL